MENDPFYCVNQSKMDLPGMDSYVKLLEGNQS